MGFEGYHFIQSGTLGEEYERFKPTGEIFTGSRVQWLDALEGAEQFEGSDGNVDSATNIV